MRVGSEVALRGAVAVIVLTWTVFIGVAGHEYMHCQAAWLGGKDDSCTVTYLEPGSTDDREGFAHGTASYNDFDTHWIIIPFQAVAVLATFAIVATWTVRPILKPKKRPKPRPGVA